MLSRILHMHPDVLSVSEFFNAVTGSEHRWDFPTEDMDGKELWRLLSAPSPLKDGVVQAGLRASEMVYPYETGRFDPATGVPTICNATLPMLTDDPDTLFDQLAAEVPTWPKRGAADQYRALFALMGRLLGRRVTVERSGSSLPYVPVLRQLFPEANFVLQYRDGPDCAMSMSRHVSGKYAGIMQDALRVTGLPPTTTWEELVAAAPSEFDGLLAPPFDVKKMMDYPIPITFYGEVWGWMMSVGIAALKRLPRDIWTTMNYEVLMQQPREELTRLAGFIGISADEQWLDKAAGFVDPGRTGSAGSKLEAKTFAALQQACTAGTKAIQALEAEYPR
jgi:hypothetical protein